MNNDITIDPTAIEIAELLSQCKSIPALELTVRRLAYQYDRLLELEQDLDSTVRQDAFDIYDKEETDE